MVEFCVRLLRIQTERKPRRNNCFSCHPLHLSFPAVCNASWWRDFFFFSQGAFGSHPCQLIGVKVLLSSSGWLVVCWRETLTWLAQTWESYGCSKILSFIGQEAPDFPLPWNRGKSLLSELVSEASEEHSGGGQYYGPKEISSWSCLTGTDVLFNL